MSITKASTAQESIPEGISQVIIKEEFIKICPVTEFDIKQKSWGVNTRNKRQGRSVDLFPSDQDLPWHFSWIDDKMIGGSSIPCERINYPAILKQNVGLLVNLTEEPVTCGSLESCAHCKYDGSQVICEEDVFEDVDEVDDLKCLFLPIKDGHVPHHKQVELFLLHAQKTIDRGKKVIVHCHAGVGRTGTFLAIYLMEKYKLDPAEAMKILRRDRPQSMQFNPDDWFTDPFLIRQPDAYERNLLQERYLYYYHSNVLLAKWNASPTDSESNQSDLATLGGRSNSLTNSFDDSITSPTSTISDLSVLEHVEPLSESKYVFLPKVNQQEVDLELYHLLEDMNSMNINQTMPEESSERSMCFHCQGVLAVGPALVIGQQNWPPSDCPIVYRHDE